MRREQSLFRRYLFRRDFFRKVKQKARGQARKYSKNAFDDQKYILKGLAAPIIFDLGANVGDVTRKYSRLFPEATIFAFEPFPKVFSQLEHNVWDLPKVHPQRLAIAKEAGERALFISRYDVMNSLLPPSKLAWGFENKDKVL